MTSEAAPDSDLDEAVFLGNKRYNYKTPSN